MSEGIPPRIHSTGKSHDPLAFTTVRSVELRTATRKAGVSDAMSGGPNVSVSWGPRPWGRHQGQAASGAKRLRPGQWPVPISSDRKVQQLDAEPGQMARTRERIRRQCRTRPWHPTFRVGAACGLCGPRRSLAIRGRIAGKFPTTGRGAKHRRDSGQEDWGGRSLGTDPNGRETAGGDAALVRTRSGGGSRPATDSPEFNAGLCS